MDERLPQVSEFFCVGPISSCLTSVGIQLITLGRAVTERILIVLSKFSREFINLVVS